MVKSQYKIDITNSKFSSLEAYQVLQNLDINHGNHLENGLRPPLGIYNTSLSRLCGRLEKCSAKLEELFKGSPNLEAVNSNQYILEETLDYLELSLYAAAEHVDDLKLIINGFFDSVKNFKKSSDAKQFLEKLKSHRNFITSVVNEIKHRQVRIRLFSQEVKYCTHNMCLHGYFIEGVNNGEIGPNKIFHGDESTVFSITSIIWEIICFILNASRDLKSFLVSQTGAQSKATKTDSDIILKAIIAAARLPLYSYDEEHPFLKTTVTIITDEKSTALLNSGLYGSLINGWGTSEKIEFFSSSSSYAGDGVTKTFKLVAPKTLKLQHWT